MARALGHHPSRWPQRLRPGWLVLAGPGASAGEGGPAGSPLTRTFFLSLRSCFSGERGQQEVGVLTRAALLPPRSGEAQEPCVSLCHPPRWLCGCGRAPAARGNPIHFLSWAGCVSSAPKDLGKLWGVEEGTPGQTGLPPASLGPLESSGAGGAGVIAQTQDIVLHTANNS